MIGPGAIQALLAHTGLGDGSDPTSAALAGFMPDLPPQPAAPPVPDMAGGDPIRALLAQTLQNQPQASGLRQKLGALNVPWSNTPRPSAASYLLRGLVSGFNGAPGGPKQSGDLSASALLKMTGGGGRGSGLNMVGPKVDPNADLKRAILQAQVDKLRQPAPEKVDPLGDLKRQLLQAQIANVNARTKKAGMAPAPKAGGSRGGQANIGQARAALAARYRARLAQRLAAVRTIGQQNGWTPEEVNAGMDRARAELGNEYNLLVRELGNQPGQVSAPDPLGIR